MQLGPETVRLHDKLALLDDGEHSREQHQQLLPKPKYKNTFGTPARKSPNSSLPPASMMSMCRLAPASGIDPGQHLLRLRGGGCLPELKLDAAEPHRWRCGWKRMSTGEKAIAPNEHGPGIQMAHAHWKPLRGEEELLKTGTEKRARRGRKRSLAGSESARRATKSAQNTDEDRNPLENWTSGGRTGRIRLLWTTSNAADAGETPCSGAPPSGERCCCDTGKACMSTWTKVKTGPTVEAAPPAQPNRLSPLRTMPAMVCREEKTLGNARKGQKRRCARIAVQVPRLARIRNACESLAASFALHFLALSACALSPP